MDVIDPKTMEASVTAEVNKEIGFFEAHPKAIAIGAFVAGVVLTLLVTHFL